MDANMDFTCSYLPTKASMHHRRKMGSPDGRKNSYSTGRCVCMYLLTQLAFIIAADARNAEHLGGIQIPVSWKAIMVKGNDLLKQPYAPLQDQNPHVSAPLRKRCRGVCPG